MLKQEKMILNKQYEIMLSYIREAHKECAQLGLIPPTHNKFYEFMKDDLSRKVTMVTNSDLKQ